MLPSPLKCFAPADAGNARSGFDPVDLEDPSVSFPNINTISSSNPSQMEDASGEDLDKTEKESVANKKKRAEMWQDSEMDALVVAYKQVHTKLLLAGKNGKHVFKSANEKWTEVRNLLLPMGVDRQPKEIERKWSNLLTAYKQIVDWNKKIGQPSYWELEDVLKKEKTKAKELPATFRVQLYESMAEFLGDRNGRRSRSWDPAGSTSTAITASNSPAVPRFETGHVEVPICLDKLGNQLLHLDGSLRRPGVILVATGSFNPPTIMHLRMFELARTRLMQDGYNVLGGYMSPVNDAYAKPGLVSAEHRIQLCQIATADSPFIMVDSWEARQPAAQRTLDVLSRIDRCINGGLTTEAAGTIRVMLLCGADFLASFSDDIWNPAHVEQICRDYGIVCFGRGERNPHQDIFQNEILCRYVSKILLVHDIAQLGISSTFIRQSFARGQSVKYLTPDGVIEYVRLHRLYNYRE